MKQANAEASLYERPGGRDGLARRLHHFYANVRRHALIGPVFNRQIDDWPAHLEKIGSFWARLTGAEPPPDRFQPFNANFLKGNFHAHEKNPA